MSYNFQIKDYGNEEIQVAFFPNFVTTGGVKNENISSIFIDNKQTSFNDINSSSTSEETALFNKIRSLRRTKQSIYDLARCNDWCYFATFTFKDKNIRYDYNLCKKKLTNFLRGFKERYCPNLKYLCVPELHKDNAIHFHALLSGFDLSLLRKSGYRHNVYYFETYGKKIGINEVEVVRNSRRVSNYIAKYITKEFFQEELGQNVHRYIASKNLKKPHVSTIYENTTLENFLKKYYSDCVIAYQYEGDLGVRYLQIKRKKD